MNPLQNPKHVLFIAPVTDHWAKVRNSIATFGYKITEASSCTKGAKILENDVSIDLVIIDSGSDNSGVIKFVEWKRKDTLLRPIPIIVGGDEFTDEMLKQYIELQVNDIILLPTDSEALKSKIIFALENSRFRILVVDDDDGVRDVLCNMLEIQRYLIYDANSVNAALEIVKNKKIDIIISDILMPNKTGFDLLVEVKKINPDIPLIFITGFSGRFTPDQALTHGADGYLKKPFNSQDLYYTLMKILSPKSLQSRPSLGITKHAKLSLEEPSQQ